MFKPMLTSSKARSFAETVWGRGGTIAYKTNRKGVYYFSCSGHGGYVVDADTLEFSEYENILEYMTPENCLVMTLNNKITFWQNPFSVRTQRYKIYRDSQTFHKQVFFFEEDCDWAILEKFTNIRRMNQNHISEQEMDKCREDTFNRWATPKTLSEMKMQA